MLFINVEHEIFYEKKVHELKADCYLKALIYTIGICEDTRRNWERIYSESDKSINSEVLFEGWQTGGNVRVMRLAFQLFTDDTPTAYRWNDDDSYTTDIEECKRYSVSEIFCCEFAPYFVQAVQIRYPQYFID